MSSIARDYQELGQLQTKALGHPVLNGLYLPAPVPDETFRDEFGFVFLNDGSVGPFYVSMDDVLQTLWTRYPEPAAYTGDASLVLAGFTEGNAVDRALALGVYNALSAAVLRDAGFHAPDRAPASGLPDLPPGSLVGMVGYFCPLIDKLMERGCAVLVLEQAPQRVVERPGVTLTIDPGDLSRCAHVLCTAATLINDSLGQILSAVAEGATVELIGPSGSGLPDPLFARGVASVGGSSFAQKSSLLECLERGESWGSAGRKYQLTPENYPGYGRLLGSIRERR